MPQQQAATDHATRREPLPLAGRQMEIRGFHRAAGDDERTPLATAELVFSSGAGVKRYDYYRERYYNEQLVVEEGAIRMERLARGAPLLNTHSGWDLESVLGVVDAPSVANGAGTCTATFSRRESIAGYVRDVEDRVIRNVSVGYVRHRMEMVPPVEEGGLWVYRVVDWEPYEVSLVPIPADMDAQVRSAAGTGPQDDERPQQRTFPCEFIELAPSVSTRAVAQPQRQESTMTEAERAAAAEQQRQADEAARAEQQRKAELAQQQQLATDAATRAADITDLCARHGVAHLAGGLIRNGNSVDAAKSAVLDELARRDAAAGGHRNTRVEKVGDEVETRMAGMEEALHHRVDTRAKLTDNGRQYRGMSLLELGRDFLESHGQLTRGVDKMTLAQRILHFRTGAHTTSDFAHLLANVANKRLRTAYEENPGSYARWARRAPNAPDFKSMKVVQLSNAPTLLRVNEHGEFKYGAMSDGAETYAVVTSGRIVSLTRQSIVNDDLRGFDRLLTGFGGAAMRLENATVYEQLTANAALADGVALFHASHANLGSGAISATSLGAMRAAMRTQTGLQGEILNLTPNWLIVPAALEQKAYEFTSTNYVPATKAEINEFRAGGRTALEPVVEPILDANSAVVWYGAASNNQIDTVEYCYLEGAEGPVVESEVGFEVDGISYKCRHDFAAKAIDHRGIWKSTGS